ncbi:MAG: FAD-binding oxidoreductase [Alphaproteobacteria bacterium]|jgi:glycine/D-amino acid oxidase-like deaminating enzyme|nr:FAD-binding oxidoreductase [Alphaproteobacteria bacterium]
MDRTADVVIIGAGIAGTAAAYYLAKGGARVVVCEKGEIAGEQSSRNWGFVRQQGRDPAEIPLMVEANKIWRGLERELNADLEWLAAGNLVTFETEEERAGWESWQKTAAQFGLSSKILGRAELEAVVPGNAFNSLGGIFTESDGQAEPTKVTAALARAAEGRGAEFLTHCAVYEVETSAGAVSGVITERGGISAPVVVCAGGAWSGRMLRTLGLKLPQMWIKGSVARTTPGPIVTHTATWTGVAFRQRRDGTFNIATRSADHDLTIESLLNLPAFMGNFARNKRDIRLHLNRLALDLRGGSFSKAALGRELTTHRILDPTPNHKVLKQTLAGLHRLLPATAKVEIDRSWAGYIDMTPDMLPTIGAAGAPSGLVLATGFSGHGFGMGPIVGRLVAELIQRGEPSLNLDAFRFSRFHDGSKLTPHSVV